MALQFITGWHGITSAMLGDRVAYVDPGHSHVIANGTGKGGRRGLRYQGGSANTINVPPSYGTETPTATAGVWFKPVAAHSGEGTRGVILGFGNYIAGGDSVSVYYEYSTQQIVVLGPSTSYTVLFSTTASAYPTGAWVYVELSVTLDDTAGTIRLSLGTESAKSATVYSASSVDTCGDDLVPADGLNNVIVGGYGQGDGYFSDLYTRDDLTQHGRSCVAAAFPSANDSVQFTPLSGTNASNVDDGETPDDDTTHNESATLNHEDMFAIAGFVAPSHTFHGFAIHTRAKASAADGRVLSTMWAHPVATSGASAVLCADELDVDFYDIVGPALDVSSPDGSFETPEAFEAFFADLLIGYKITT